MISSRGNRYTPPTLSSVRYYGGPGGAHECTVRMSTSRKDAPSSGKRGGYAALTINYKGSRVDGGKHHGMYVLSERTTFSLTILT